MSVRVARKLHNEDEVVEKKTGAVWRVIQVRIDPSAVWLDCTRPGCGLKRFRHTEVS